ncbi:FecCD family ABC transporter permease [Candidatus Methanarcanum hacksteinii]|uniref:FecCD family ABC transporter permease n=1 Tax=Candidatus Methanarcanum hacksteinii TaxID=2911857 RepID=UPI0037DCA80F
MMNEGIDEYKRTNHFRWGLILFLIVSTFIIFIISLYIGPTDVTIGEIFKNIFSVDGSWEGYVIHDIRLKRSIAAILAGIGLGVSGAVMQCVLKNPLGSPYTLGISNSAAFGAALGIMVLGGGIVTGQSVSSYIIENPYIVTISAFMFSLLATGAIILSMRIFNASPETMLLTGMALSAIFSAGIAFLQYQANELALSAIVFWQFGDLEKISWDNMWFVATIVMIAFAYLYLKRWDLNAMDLGDDIAHGLGINVPRVRILVLLLSAVMTSIIVSFVGIIGFIGLLAPHLSRKLVSNDKCLLIPTSAIIGALVLLIALMLSENAFGFTVPIGIVTSFIGGPLFLWILYGRYSKKGGIA